MSTKDIVMSAAGLTGTVAPPAWINTLTCASTVDGGSIQYDSSGNIYICGYVTDSSIRKCFIAKYDVSGTLLWQKYINATINGALYSLSIDSSGNIIFVGKLEAAGGDLIDGVFLKYSSTGSLLAQKTFNSGFDILTSITISNTGNIYTCGYTQDDIFITKLDSLLAIQWSYKYYVANLDDTNAKLVIDSSENIYLAFDSTSTTFASVSNTLVNSINLVKIDSTGTILWSTKLAQASTNLSVLSLACNSSNVYICYKTTTTSNTIATINNAGVLVRKNVINGLTASNASAIVVNSVGAMYHLSTGTATTSYAVVTAYDSSGGIYWNNKIGVSGSNTQGISISLDNISGFYILCKISNIFVVCKFPTTGNKLSSYTVGSRTFVYSSSTGTITFATTDSVTISAGAVLKKSFPPSTQIGFITGVNPQTYGSHIPRAGFRFSDSSSNYYYVYPSGLGYNLGSFKVTSSGVYVSYFNTNITAGYSTSLLAAGDTTDSIYQLLSDGNNIIRLIKILKSDLSIVWSKNFSVGSYTYGGVIKVSSAGNIYLSIGPELYKLNSSGTVLNSIKLTTASIMISDIAISSAEDVYITTAYGGNNVVCIKFNSSLVTQWSCSYNHQYAISNITSKITISSDGTKIVIATNMNFITSYSSTVVIGITSAGAEIFKKAIAAVSPNRQLTCRLEKTASDLIYLTTVGKDTGDLIESIRLYSLDFNGNFNTPIVKIIVGDSVGNPNDLFCWGMSFNSSNSVLTLNISCSKGSFDIPLYINDITPNTIINIIGTTSLYITTAISLTFAATTSTTRTYSATISSGAVGGAFGAATNITPNSGTSTSLSWLPIDAPLTISSSSFTDATASNTSVTTIIA
jgi:hypothetical protein